MQASGLPSSGEERTCQARARLGQTVLGRWRLEKLIGVGGMAAVFEASQPQGAPAAIKILHADLADNVDIRERFIAEAYAANRVAHPGVVTVRDEGTTEDGAVFLVMDLLRGETLAERLRPAGAPLSVGEVLEITSQLLDVLEHAHDRGVVHRDIKPENVFLMVDGRVRLLDFGLARVATDETTHTPKPGNTIGTPAFMPPEQASGDYAGLDGRSDLWSLGATMYLLLSGQPVRASGSATELLLGAMTRPVPSLGDVTALPRSVVAVVDRALSFDRADRFPNARSMQLALEAAFEELAQPDSHASVPPASEEPVALSLRTPFPRGRKPSLTPAATTSALSTLRPVAASTTPLPLPQQAAPSRSALPVFVTLGFAIGIGLVVLARAFVTIVAEPAVSLQPVAAPELPARATPSAKPSASVAVDAAHLPKLAAPLER